MGYQRLHIPKNRIGWIQRFNPIHSLGTLHFHSHRELEINLVVRGKGSYLINGGRYPIRKGSLLWLFPAQPHVLFEASEDFSMWVVVFRPRAVHQLTVDTDPATRILEKRDPGSIYVQELQEDGFTFLTGMMSQLSRIDGEDHAFFNTGLGYLLRLAWDAGTKSASLRAEGSVHWAVERAIHLMREGGLEGSLVDLARRVGISYSRLCGLIRTQTGETLGHIRNSMRVQRLKELMVLHPERTLLDLSLEAGFGSYAQCHRMVTRLTGRSPARLRLKA